MRHMQAQRLDRCAHRNIFAYINVIVFREELAGFFQRIQFAVSLAHLGSVILPQRIHNRLRAVLRHGFIYQTGYRIADIIQYMHCAGIHVQHKI